MKSLDRLALTRFVLAEAVRLGVPVRAAGTVAHVGVETPLDAAEFEARVEAMRIWCRSVERVLCDRPLESLRVHAGFERLSRLRPVLPRYRRIATRAAQVVVYGTPDARVDVPGLDVAPLGFGALANEWFVAARARGFAALVTAEDLDGFGGGVQLGERRFRGLVTHHPALVEAAIDALEHARGDARSAPAPG